MEITYKRYTALNELTKARVMVNDLFVGVVRQNGCYGYFETVPTSENGLTKQRSIDTIDASKLEKAIRLMVMDIF